MRRGETERRGEAGGEVRCFSTYRVDLKHETQKERPMRMK